jgi:hypothetical protein
MQGLWAMVIETGFGQSSNVTCSSTGFRPHQLFGSTGAILPRKAFDLRDIVFEESYPTQPRFGGGHCVSDFLSADSESFTGNR